MDVNGCIDNDVEGNGNMDPEYSDSKEGSYLNHMPAQVERHLDFVTSNKNGHILLGSSNLTGRYWCGSVWYYKNPHLAPDVESSVAALEFQTGVTDCVFMNENRAVIGQDGGFITFLSVKESDGVVNLEKTAEIEDHCSSVVAVKLSCDATAVITASMDMSIRLWDCTTTAIKKILNPAHNQPITDVSPHPTQPEMFLSSSLDGNVLLWDLRSPKPASCVFRDLDDCPSALSWDTSNPDRYLVGTHSGELVLRDPGVTYENLFSYQCLTRPIFRIVPDPHRINRMAVCGNETRVNVISVQEGGIQTSYTDDRHTDFVRGLTWAEEGRLISCGWDKHVFQHSIS